ncbi:MAG: hypothetical protein J2O48_02330, partial [Solirubrobacterales bacterium]|nr:hypothetical protein [Solirubrobacterales bacterium]
MKTILSGLQKPAERRPVPTVWFAGYPDRGPFDQLAASLRKRGLRVVRLLHTPGSRLSRCVDRLLYHRIVTLDDLVSGRDGPDPEREELVDVLWTEGMSQVVPDAVLDRFGERVSADLRARRELVNKRVVAARLEAAGIPVARHLDAATTTDAAAVAELGA